jgi:hypothetical protein
MTARGGPVRAQRQASIATLVVGLVMTVAAWIAAGGDGLAAGAAGTVVVVAFFWSGTIPVFITRGAESTALGMGVLLLTYSLRIVIVLAVLALIGQADVVNERWLGATVIVCALSWAAAHAVFALRSGESGGGSAAEAGPAEG